MKSNYLIVPILAISLLLSTFVSFAETVSPPRDIQYHWAGNYIYTLLNSHIVSGYEDGRFKPDKTISLEELSALLVSYGRQKGLIAEENLSGSEVLNTSSDVATSSSEVSNTTLDDGLTHEVTVPSDLTSQWSRPYLMYLIKQGVIHADSANCIYPQQIMTRETFASILYSFKANVESYAFSNTTTTEALPFQDITASYAKGAIAALHQEGILNGYSDGSFQPYNSITRAEVAVILQKMSGDSLMILSPTLPTSQVLAVPYVSQVSPVYAPVGCEGAALLMGLHSKGYAQNIDLRELLDAMPKHPSNPEKGYVGSPYTPDKTKKTRTTIFPQKLAEFGQTYGKVSNFSGSSIPELRAEVLYGNPVIIYATMNWEKPFYRTYSVEGTEKRFLSNNHVVLLSGYDSRTNQYYISDPYNINNRSAELRYWIDGATFERIYNERRHAVVIE